MEMKAKISRLAAAILLAGGIAAGANAAPAGDGGAAAPHTIEITVTDQGYEPSRLELPGDELTRLAFTNKADARCATSVRSQDLGIPKTQLPKGETIIVEVEPEKAGEYTFTCGMGMLKGTVVVAAP